MSQRGETQLVLLWRDPEVGYVYWEVDPALKEELWICLSKREGSEARRLEVERWRVDEALSGRFVRIEEPGARYQAELWRGDVVGSGEPILCSEMSRAPRRAPGSGAERFVRVSWQERGLGFEPTEHRHPVRGRFAAGTGPRLSSMAFMRSEDLRGEKGDM
ncbi:DUF4912 domain-containing protein [Lujinxingia litoralis]|nr:DUF4912 domain-containing protein [Lujinxingia litoralis]